MAPRCPSPSCLPSGSSSEIACQYDEATAPNSSPGRCDDGATPTRRPGKRSGRDDEFPGCGAGLHRFVCLHDLIEIEDAVDRYDGVTGGDGIQKFLQNRVGQVFSLAVIGGQADSSGQVLDRVEVG